MKHKPRIDYVEMPIETEFDFDPPEKEYFNAALGEGHPGSAGGATLTRAELVYRECSCAVCGRTLQSGEVALRCHPNAMVLTDEKRIDILDALSPEQRASLEEAYFAEMTEEPDEPDYDPPDPEPYDPRGREGW